MLRIVKSHWRIGLLALLVLSVHSGARRASSDTPFSVYLPLVLDKPCLPRGQVIFGCVEQNDVRLGGVQLTLFHQYVAHPQASTTVANAISDAEGYFDFGNVPALAAPDLYLATYENNSDPARLGFWDAAVYYEHGGQHDLGIVDLTNIPLFAPADGLHVTIPYTFTWGVRASSPNDYYLLVIRDPGNLGISYFQGAFHNGYSTLGYLPSGFQLGKTYTWQVQLSQIYVTVYPYQNWHVTFDSTHQPQTASGGWQPLLTLFKLRGGASPGP